jgi:hypothetical protein
MNKNTKKTKLHPETDLQETLVTSLREIAKFAASQEREYWDTGLRLPLILTTNCNIKVRVPVVTLFHMIWNPESMTLHFSDLPETRQKTLLTPAAVALGCLITAPWDRVCDTFSFRLFNDTISSWTIQRTIIGRWVNDELDRVWEGSGPGLIETASVV